MISPVASGRAAWPCRSPPPLTDFWLCAVGSSEVIGGHRSHKRSRSRFAGGQQALTVGLECLFWRKPTFLIVSGCRGRTTIDYLMGPATPCPLLIKPSSHALGGKCMYTRDTALALHQNATLVARAIGYRAMTTPDGPVKMVVIMVDEKGD